MHDRHLLPIPMTRLSAAEAYHWQHAITLFNAKLSGRIDASERDAVWATAILIGVVTLCHIEATTADEAWPVAAPSALDLNWIQMSNGKKEIWKLAGLEKSGSILQPWSGSSAPVPVPQAQDLRILPTEMIHLLSLDSNASLSSNPYYAAASALGQCLAIDQGKSIMMCFLIFVSDLQPMYKSLLERKDPRALLILAWWNAKVSQMEECWWILRRVVLEGRAICRYLRRWAREMGEKVEALVDRPRKALDAVHC